MIESEMVFANLSDILDLAENLLKNVVKTIIKNNQLELEYLEQYHQKELVNELKKIINLNFPRPTYTECLEILIKNKKNFVYNEIE